MKKTNEGKPARKVNKQLSKKATATNNIEDFIQIRLRAIEELPAIESEINNHVQEIVSLASILPPDRLLHRAWWASVSAFTDPALPKGSSKQITALRFVEYLQCIVSSAQPANSYLEDITEEQWHYLEIQLVGLYSNLSKFQLLNDLKNDTGGSSIAEKTQFHSELRWVLQRGLRYELHEIQNLRELLTPHSAELLKLFGIHAEALVTEFGKIQKKLTKGLAEAKAELQRLGIELVESEEKSFLRAREASSANNPDLAARADQLIEEFFGFGLFDLQVTTKIPISLLSELAWSPGEEPRFLSPGEYSGWPLRDLPTKLRPFIKINKRYYCFDNYVLFDNLYRTLQRIVTRLDRGYKEQWKIRQQAMSETLPFDYLSRLLPGAKIYKPVYYESKIGAKLEWCETDGLLVYDDHLFILEIKGASFTYTSPSTDFKAHENSIDALLVKAISQARRFADYLDSSDEVALFDSAHDEIGRIRRVNFRKVTPCAITVDPVTEIAARSNQFSELSQAAGTKPIWVLAIDDLRVFADIFDNSLIFLHFVEQRMRAAVSHETNLTDEMDHLGLYFSHNAYAEAISRSSAPNEDITIVGASENIDEYFNARFIGESPPPVHQELGHRLSEIIYFLSQSALKDRSRLACQLLDLSRQQRHSFSQIIDSQLADISQGGKYQTLHLEGPMGFSFIVRSPPFLKDQQKGLNLAAALAVYKGENQRLFVDLEYSSQLSLVEIKWQYIDVENFPQVELDELRLLGEQLALERVQRANKKLKIGRNKMCPCGSGLKFKRCHGARQAD